jgi:hypothetical protein
MTFVLIHTNTTLAQTLTAGQTLTAICKYPKGHAHGIQGTRSGNKPFDKPDDLGEGQITIVWNVGQKHAQIVVQSVGGFPATVTATHVHTSSESVSFLYTYFDGAGLDSLYLKPQYLLSSHHSPGLAADTGGAIVHSMTAKCNISLN